jgi:hypothetical protein
VVQYQFRVVLVRQHQLVLSEYKVLVLVLTGSLVNCPLYLGRVHLAAAVKSKYQLVAQQQVDQVLPLLMEELQQGRLVDLPFSFQESQLIRLVVQ